MRVIAGTARRLLLMTPAGTNTRPTTDRIKETLFNMLQPHLAGRDFLDLFAGSGGIGIEALSRGARYACFADSSRDAIECIKTNLTHTHLADRATVYPMDAMAAIARMHNEKRKFDIVFLDPPYGKGLELQALAAMRRCGVLAEDATVIVETSADSDPEALAAAGYRIERLKDYNTNRQVFLTPESGQSSEGTEEI